MHSLYLDIYLVLACLAHGTVYTKNFSSSNFLIFSLQPKVRLLCSFENCWYQIEQESYEQSQILNENFISK